MNSETGADYRQPWQNIAVGGAIVSVLWDDVVVSEESLRIGQSDQTVAKADTLKAPVRRAEFERSRWLLRHLGQWPTDPIQRPEGDIEWPEGWVGSITHKSGHVACVIDKSAKWRSVGIDLEGMKRAHVRLSKQILREDEFHWLSGDEDKDAELVSLAFSAKEALFKAVFPIGRKMFWFEGARINAWHQNFGHHHLMMEIIGDAGADVPRGQVVEAHGVSIDHDGKNYWLTFVGLS